MKRFALIPALFVLAATQPALAGASPQEPIAKMVDAFNRGDVTAAKATHVDAPAIVDEVGAPYVWTGPKAFDTWIADLVQAEAASGKTGGKVTIGAPIRESVSGDHAYVVVPSTYVFRQKGLTMREVGTMTFALVQAGGAWKIAAWTWSSPEATPVK